MRIFPHPPTPLPKNRSKFYLDGKLVRPIFWERGARLDQEVGARLLEDLAPGLGVRGIALRKLASD